jgi:hypothetical protein
MNRTPGENTVLTSPSFTHFPAHELELIELMFAQWHDRLYGNFRGDEADDALSSTELINGSFFLPDAGSQSSQEEWETLNMTHFLVYDGTSDLSSARSSVMK